MAARPLLGTKTALNVPTLPTLPNGGRALSDELSSVDVSLNGMAAFFDVAVSQAAPEANTVDVYVIGTNTSGDYGTSANNSNPDYLGSVDLSESTPKKHLALGVVPPFFKLLFVNNGAVQLTGATVDYVSQTYQEAT